MNPQMTQWLNAFVNVYLILECKIMTGFDRILLDIVLSTKNKNEFKIITITCFINFYCYQYSDFFLYLY